MKLKKWSVGLKDAFDGESKLILTSPSSEWGKSKNFTKLKHYVSDFTLPLKCNEVTAIQTMCDYFSDFPEHSRKRLYQALLDYVVIHEDCELSQKMELVIHTNDNFSTLHWMPSISGGSWNEISEWEYRRAA
jgi:hypothetical protein